MEQSYNLLSFILLSVIIFYSYSLANGDLQTYIVHVHGNKNFLSKEDRKTWHKSFLPVEIDSVDNQPRLLYSYDTVASGFAARFTKSELEDVKSNPRVRHVFADRMLPLQTTHSPDFLGLNRRQPGFWTNSSFGKGVIIGVIDSGISPNHVSFSDKEMPPPPSKWKGVCEFDTLRCNNKLIGARSFVRGSETMRGLQTTSAVQSPDDSVGHGSHVAGTATGTFVGNASIKNQASGLASGMAPLAHLAIYKVCSSISNCSASDVLAGMDAAIADGVDILSISLGGSSVALYKDIIAIGALAAVERGIFVSCAAGNNGPFYYTVINDAPWVLTVGASTTDRSIQATVRLGDNRSSFNGQSANQAIKAPNILLPLVYPIGGNASFCTNGSLTDLDVRGKVVLCDDGIVESIEKGVVVKAAGGAAMIIANLQQQGSTIVSRDHVLPASQVSYSDGLSIKTYINSDQAPTATILFEGTFIGETPAPTVSFFSSRGPSQTHPNILKPDIIGPGTNILAAGLESPTHFVLQSGTSMATPHLSGIAALLKSAHPEWSPAAIKSAMMTTTDINANDGSPIRNQNLNPADFFATGAGQVNPSRASSPGLIYDIEPENYIAYLCSLPYTDEQVSAVARQSVNCSAIKSISGSDLNYPTIMVTLSPTNNYNVTVTRTVTNVGAPDSAYTRQLRFPLDVSVVVKPERLAFTKANEKAVYSVTFSQTDHGINNFTYLTGYLTWISSDERTIVRSPIVAGSS